MYYVPNQWHHHSHSVACGSPLWFCLFLWCSVATEAQNHQNDQAFLLGSTKLKKNNFSTSIFVNQQEISFIFILHMHCFKNLIHLHLN